MSGRYEGRCALTFLEDGRRVRLLEPFAYIDPSSTRWSVPIDAIVDGASIPRALWTLVGGPFEGLYRDASVIHDWYCDRRNRPWRQVHRVFFDAMCTSGVAEVRAKVMYAAVFAGGPRWSDTVVQNNNLNQPRGRGGFAGGGKGIDVFARPPLLERPDLKSEELETLAAKVDAENPSLDEIDAMIEGEGFDESR